MKKINFLVTEKGFRPLKHLNHKGYEDISYDTIALLYHDIVDHGNNQDGSIEKELLAQGASFYRIDKNPKIYKTLNKYQILYESVCVLIQNKPFLKELETNIQISINKGFNKILDFAHFKKEILRMIYNVSNLESGDVSSDVYLKNVYNYLYKGYYQRKKRKDYNIDFIKLIKETTKLLKLKKDINSKEMKIGKIVSINLENIVY